MRERAAALGGTVTAGPRAEGGWQVRAVLPPPGTAARPRGRRWDSRTVLDAGVVLLTLALPLAMLAVAADEGARPATVTLLLLAAVAQSAPLMWRRGHPWPVLAAVAVATWLAPPLLATGVAPTGDVFVFGPAGLAAVYAVAAHGARSWLAPLVSLASTALVLGVLTVIEPAPDRPAGPMAVAVTLFSAAFAAVLLAVPYAGAWLAGRLVRQRRERRHDRERGAIAVEQMRAEARARTERARVADGLRVAVLEHAARVPRAAEEADLPGVLDAARAALAAMRGLLDALGPG
jgi:hypothetical protein